VLQWMKAWKNTLNLTRRKELSFCGDMPFFNYNYTQEGDESLIGYVRFGKFKLCISRQILIFALAFLCFFPFCTADVFLLTTWDLEKA
jgi:hypothetical protein